MKQAGREYLPHSSRCFICGDENSCGVRTRFYVEEGAVRARLALPRHVNGYKDLAHGGIIAALLDESMGWAATVFGRRHPMYVTGELTLKYIAPVPVGEEVEVVSRLEKDAGRLAYSTGELVFGGKVCVRARGKFLPMSEEAIRQVIRYLKFDFCGKYRTLFGRTGEDG